MKFHDKAGNHPQRGGNENSLAVVSHSYELEPIPIFESQRRRNILFIWNENARAGDEPAILQAGKFNFLVQKDQQCNKNCTDISFIGDAIDKRTLETHNLK